LSQANKNVSFAFTFYEHIPCTESRTRCIRQGNKREESVKTDELVLESGASTPYKRWSKCTMEKVVEKRFCRNLGGECINY